jgi:hypothetical protein
MLSLKGRQLCFLCGLLAKKIAHICSLFLKVSIVLLGDTERCETMTAGTKH